MSSFDNLASDGSVLNEKKSFLVSHQPAICAGDRKSRRRSAK
jgi:hypothetical protein